MVVTVIGGHDHRGNLGDHSMIGSLRAPATRLDPSRPVKCVSRYASIAYSDFRHRVTLYAFRRGMVFEYGDCDVFGSLDNLGIRSAIGLGMKCNKAMKPQCFESEDDYLTHQYLEAVDGPSSGGEDDECDIADASFYRAERMRLGFGCDGEEPNNGFMYDDPSECD